MSTTAMMPATTRHPPPTRSALGAAGRAKMPGRTGRTEKNPEAERAVVSQAPPLEGAPGGSKGPLSPVTPKGAQSPLHGTQAPAPSEG